MRRTHTGMGPETWNLWPENQFTRFAHTQNYNILNIFLLSLSLSLSSAAAAAGSRLILVWAALLFGIEREPPRTSERASTQENEIEKVENKFQYCSCKVCVSVLVVCVCLWHCLCISRIPTLCNFSLLFVWLVWWFVCVFNFSNCLNSFGSGAIVQDTHTRAFHSK